MTPTIAMENFGVFDQHICLVGHTHKPAIYRWRLHMLNGDGLSVHDSNGYDHPSADAENDHAFGEDDEDDNSHKIATVDYIQPPEGSSVSLDVSNSHRLILNPGSVGQPRDNDARAAYAILDTEEMTWQHFRVAYPVELTQSQMRAANLPKRLIDRLSFGW
jgi:diadenosine tetraphosphatase ApaH/serine/threonine PP2A family protein phosphatase